MFSEKGTDEETGFEWTIDGRQSKHDDRYFAIVQVGTAIRVTEPVYTESDMKAAARVLVADTIAELVEDEKWLSPTS